MPAPPVDLPSPMSRNAPCPCGSARRYKDCHGRLDGTDVRSQNAATSHGAGPTTLRDRSPSKVLRDAGILNDRGTLLQSQRRYDEALNCFDAALILAPDHPGMLFNRGNALLDLRRIEEAVQCFAR